MDAEVDVEILSESRAAVVSLKAASISDVDAIAAMSAQIRQFVEENRPENVIFDFSQVKFFSSQVLGLLLETRGNLAERDGHVAISALDPQLHRVFKITNLDRIFEFFPDKETALKATGSRDGG
ncbi:MAG: STAS domain-containing protein [Phycisphaerales bacterium]|nr:MAG: STAS domain-containing protein [Phycisphaerales bacterium]